MPMKQFSVRDVMFAITIICVGFGAYSRGVESGRRQGHLHGYAEAEDHYQVMLSSYAYTPDVWEYIGDLWREYPSMTIISHRPLETEEQWKNFVKYHAQRNGWKDAGVFRRLEDRERIYAEAQRQRAMSDAPTAEAKGSE